METIYFELCENIFPPPPPLSSADLLLARIRTCAIALIQKYQCLRLSDLLYRVTYIVAINLVRLV